MSSFYDDASLVVIPSGYKTSKVYAEKPTDGSGDLAFTRTGDTATRVNSAGLIERVRTNLVLQSEAFNTTWYAASLSVTANTTANPLNGALTADTLTLTGATTQKYITQPIVFNGSATVSVYLKAGTHQFVQFLLGTDTAPIANFDLTNGTSSATNSTASIVSVGGGFFRCSMSFTSTTGTDIIILAVDSLAATRFLSTASTGNFIAFGAQIETGDIATDYIPTTTAAVSVGPVANVPRLDYLGSTCPRLLLEPQRTNLALYSEQINNTGVYAIQQSAVTANAIASPDGTTNADLWYPTSNSNTGSCRLLQTITGPSSGVSYTASIFVKRNNKRWLYFSAPDASSPNHNAFFDIQNGIVGNIGSLVTGATIENYGNGWYRCSVTSTATSTTQYIFVSAANGNGDQSVTANGTDGFYFYGSQLEASAAYATSYIPTLASASTRSADACSKTGISSLIGQTEGTLFVESELSHSSSSNQYLIQVSASSADRIFIYREANTNKLGCFVRIGSTTIYTQLTAGAITGTVKAAFAYKSGSLAFYVNGTQVALGTSTFSTPPSMGIFDIDSNSGLENGYFNYNQALLLPTRLTNAELAELTTL